MTKPTIVCVPGAWHSPEIYQDTIHNLESHGYQGIGLPIPSVGAAPPHENFDDDVKGIRDCLEKLVDEGKDVVLVLHSYTGIPGSEATKGLAKVDREKRGLSGGLVRLVFIMAYAVPEGFCPMAGGAQYPEWMKIDAENGIVTVDADDAKDIFYHDLTAEDGDKWVSKLRHQSLGVFTSTTSYAGWKDIPSTYVIGTQDKSTFTRAVVDTMLAGARKDTAAAFDVVEECDGGHCLMLSRSDWLAGVLRRAAGETL